MRNFICLFLVLAAAAVVFGQKTFEVQNFSKDYYGKVYIEDPSEVFSKGWVAIYDKKTNRQLIKVVADELVSNTEDGKITANVKELPYGEQSVIIHDDFNFDSIKDFALMDGQNSCYHGPSFKVYLGSKIKGRFVLNQAFTRLAQDYCGMFDVDKAKKKISTMTKSGCCWHQFSEYIVVNNQPKAVKIVEESAMNFPFRETSTEIRNGRKSVVTSVRTVDLENEELKVLLSFKTANNDRVVLFSHDEQLHYVLINQKQNVELAYPKDSGQENPTFTLDSKENPTSLTFVNKGATYKVYETADGKIGVAVNVRGKASDIPGEINSRKGNLRQVVAANLTNITFK